jgi:hypothetical protein
MYRNLAQKWVVFAFTTADGEPALDDELNIDAKIIRDGASPAVALGDPAPVELESGYYAFELTAAETDFSHLTIVPTSSTGTVSVVGAPSTVFTFEHVVSGICNTATGSTTTTVPSSLEETGYLYTIDDSFVGRVLIFDEGTTTAALRQQAGTISAYNGTTGLITVSTAFTVAPASGETFKIY